MAEGELRARSYKSKYDFYFTSPQQPCKEKCLKNVFLERFFFFPLLTWASSYQRADLQTVSLEITNCNGHSSTNTRADLPGLNTSSVYLAEHEIQ